MATQSELAQIQHILGKRRGAEHNPLDLSARKKSREYLDSHKDVEKRRRDRINTCLDTIRTLVPLCHQLPRHRRVDKADLLDLAIIYLRMVNKLLEKLGVTDIFSAAHQQMGLFTSLEKWLRQQGEKHSDVPTFTKDILSYLENEMETASHVIASQQTSAAGPDTGLMSDTDWVKHEQSSPDVMSLGRRSYPMLSGSDEESCHGEVNSSSEDSMSNHADSQKSYQHFHQNDSYMTVANCRQDSESTRMRTQMSNANGYHDMMRYTSPCLVETREQLPVETKPVCIDKGVNTDPNLTNSGWPPNTSFTLPIISGKIVLHTPGGSLGSNNLNAPVTVHAEIHSVSSPEPCQTVKPLPQPPQPPRESEPRCETGPPAEAPLERTVSPKPCMGRCKSRSCSLPINHVACPTNTRASPNFTPSKSSINVPVPGTYIDMNCNPVDERHRKMFLDDSATRIAKSEEKYYAPLIPVMQFGEDRNKKCLSSDSVQTIHNTDHHQSREGYRHGQMDDGHYSRRFHTSASQRPQETGNKNTTINATASMNSQQHERFQTTSSSMKMKSLMVHRHQAQRILSR